jgi:hypothetical protein
MIDDFEKVKEQLKELAPIVNSFKSESVQVKVVELLLARSLGTVGRITDVPRDEAMPKKSQRRRPRKKPETKVDGAATTESSEENNQVEQSRKRTTRAGSGAQSLVNNLFDEGFFSSPQTIASIISHCGTSKGHHFKPNQLSPPLLRLLRDAKLTRAKNSENQYEYTKA